MHSLYTYLETLTVLRDYNEGVFNASYWSPLLPIVLGFAVHVYVKLLSQLVHGPNAFSREYPNFNYD